MKPPVRRIVALIAAALGLVSLRVLSEVPWAPTDGDRALLRLSWRTTGRAVRECRAPTPEEFEALPRHMRRTEICERRIPPYRLRVELDGIPLEDARVTASGARSDRPLYVYREFTVEPGDHRLRVRFHRADPPSGARDGEEAEARSGQGTPGSGTGTGAGTDGGRRELDARFRAERGRVTLVTYDPDVGSLVIRPARSVSPSSQAGTAP